MIFWSITLVVLLKVRRCVRWALAWLVALLTVRCCVRWALAWQVALLTVRCCVRVPRFRSAPTSRNGRP